MRGYLLTKKKHAEKRAPLKILCDTGFSIPLNVPPVSGS